MPKGVSSDQTYIYRNNDAVTTSNNDSVANAIKDAKRHERAANQNSVNKYIRDLAMQGYSILKIYEMAKREAENLGLENFVTLQKVNFYYKDVMKKAQEENHQDR